MSRSKTYTLLAGLALIILTNAVVLVGVRYNRSGEPEAVVVLTERELRLPYSYGLNKENSGLSLRLNWRPSFGTESTYGYSNKWDPIEWLDRQKIEELGFDVNGSLDHPETRRRIEKLLSREVFLVLEYDAEAYQQALLNAKQSFLEAADVAQKSPGSKEFKERLEVAQTNLKNEGRSSSRLFVIDAGLDYAYLRFRHVDRARTLIVRGVVDVSVYQDNHKIWRVSGSIKRVSVDEVNVPREFRHVFDPLRAGVGWQDYHNMPPRYTVKLAYGKRLEPWIIDAAGIKGNR